MPSPAKYVIRLTARRNASVIYLSSTPPGGFKTDEAAAEIFDFTAAKKMLNQYGNLEDHYIISIDRVDIGPALALDFSFRFLDL
jgi:hypothetical protein